MQPKEAVGGHAHYKIKLQFYNSFPLVTNKDWRSRRNSVPKEPKFSTTNSWENTDFNVFAEYCPQCNKPHKMGTMKCTAFKTALNIARKQERNRNRNAKAENTPIVVPRKFLEFLTEVDTITNANLVNSEEEVVQID
ncbi:hypothetical protein JTB14_000010 [Gonioctena quinquepunctata]|nr:hypothetical protein JTB14_000010 [Gonioctena quinquepunctata]